MKKQIATLLLASTFSVASFAQAPAWNIIEIGYGQADIDDFSEISPSGFALRGSVLLNENVFIDASYSLLSDDFEGVDLDVDAASVGLGYRFGLSASTDAYTSLSYIYNEASASGFGQSESIDDSGYGLVAGVRSRLTDQFEVDGALGYVDIGDDSGTSFTVSGHYFFTQQIALGLSYSTSADSSTTAISLRYAF